MQKYMTISQYCEYSGLPDTLVRRLTRSYKGDEFSFRSSGSRSAPIYINVAKLDRMLENGDLKEVLEG